MLGTRKGGSSSKSREPMGTTITTDNGQQVTASQFISQLDDAATKRLHRMNQMLLPLADDAAMKRLHRMNQRLRLLELQMETLETEVGKASSDSYE